MQSKTEWLLSSACAVVWCFVAVPSVSSQAGEVMESDDEGGAEANQDRRAERISARDWGERARSGDATEYGGEEDEHADQDTASDTEESAPMAYRVGADNGIEVGGHMLVSFFTIPSLPSLRPGLGFDGRIATTVFKDIVAEADVGIMFNKDSVDDSYTAASLRIGGRYPIDIGANPVLFFVGAGAALEFLSATNTAVGMSVMKLEKSAITPALDLQFGAIYDVSERFAIEALVQGTYAFSNVVWMNKDASWIALSGGVSYDL